MSYDVIYRSRGETDITTVFGTVIAGSNPAESIRTRIPLGAECAGFEARLSIFRGLSEEKANWGTETACPSVALCGGG